MVRPPKINILTKMGRLDWRLIAAAIGFPAVPIFLAWQLLHFGQIKLRNIGVIALSGTPIKLAVFAIAWLAMCAFAVFLWVWMISDRAQDPYRPRWKPEFDDPDDRRPIVPDK